MFKSSPLTCHFWDFWVFPSKVVTIIMSILNWKVNSYSNFTSFFIVITQNFLVNFKLIHFLLLVKGPHQFQIFGLSNMFWWKFAKFFMSFLKPQVISPSIFESIFSGIKNNSYIPFLAQTYTLVKRSPLKCKFLRFLSARVEFVKLLMSVLNWQVNSSSHFVSFFIVMTQNSPVTFKLIHFLLWIKGSHQSSNF